MVKYSADRSATLFICVDSVSFCRFSWWVAEKERSHGREEEKYKLYCRFLGLGNMLGREPTNSFWSEDKNKTMSYLQHCKLWHPSWPGAGTGAGATACCCCRCCGHHRLAALQSAWRAPAPRQPRAASAAAPALWGGSASEQRWRMWPGTGWTFAHQGTETSKKNVNNRPYKAALQDEGGKEWPGTGRTSGDREAETQK